MGLSLRKALRILGNQRKAAWKWWLEQSLSSLYDKPSILQHSILGKEGEGADLARLHGVISSIISCSISVLAVQLKGCHLIWGRGKLRGGQCSLLWLLFKTVLESLLSIWRSVGTAGCEPTLWCLALSYRLIWSTDATCQAWKQTAIRFPRWVHITELFPEQIHHFHSNCHCLLL